MNWLVTCLLLIVLKVNCDCENGPHKHEFVPSETMRDVDASVYQFGEYLREKRGGNIDHSKPSLTFKNNSFKIAVFTDLHYGEGEVKLSHIRFK